MKRLLLLVVVVGVMFLGCSQSKQDYRAEGELEKENQSEGKGQAKQVVVASKIREVSIYGVIVEKTLKELGIERCEVKDGITVMPSDKACYEKEGSISLIWGWKPTRSPDFREI